MEGSRRILRFLAPLLLFACHAEKNVPFSESRMKNLKATRFEDGSFVWELKSGEAFFADKIFAENIEFVLYEKGIESVFAKASKATFSSSEKRPQYMENVEVLRLSDGSYFVLEDLRFDEKNLQYRTDKKIFYKTAEREIYGDGLVADISFSTVEVRNPVGVGPD